MKGIKMKFCYAFRRFSDYPFLGNAFDMDPERITPKFLKRVKNMGFDGIELGIECLEKIKGGELKYIHHQLVNIGSRAKTGGNTDTSQA